MAATSPLVVREVGGWSTTRGFHQSLEIGTRHRLLVFLHNTKKICRSDSEVADTLNWRHMVAGVKVVIILDRR